MDSRPCRSRTSGVRHALPPMSLGTSGWSDMVLDAKCDIDPRKPALPLLRSLAHLLGKELPPAVQTAHHGSYGDTESTGGIEIGPLLEIDEDDHVAKSRRQALQGATRRPHQRAAVRRA